MSNRAWYAIRIVLTLIVMGGLALDAYVHLDVANDYDSISTSTLSQGDLFRIEAALAIVAALLVALRPRRWTALIAFLVGVGGLAAVVLYTYVNVGQLGPIPNMYEPAWFPEKTQSAWGEGIAAAGALLLLAVTHLHMRQSARKASQPGASGTPEPEGAPTRLAGSATPPAG